MPLEQHAVTVARRTKQHDLPPLPRYEPGMDRGEMILLRHWVRAVRRHRSMSQSAVIQETVRVYPEYALSIPQLSKLESGRLLLTELPSGQLEALRRALDVPSHVWRQAFSEAPQKYEKRAHVTRHSG